jgi:DNA-binding transcriptional regulator/RsmH inhibitor MraZ
MARMEIFGGASLVGIDSQGRMTLPERLLEGFLLDKTVDRELVLLGDWNRVVFHSGLRYRDLAAKAQVNLDEALTQVEVSARKSKPEIQAEREA